MTISVGGLTLTPTRVALSLISNSISLKRTFLKKVHGARHRNRHKNRNYKISCPCEENKKGHIGMT